MPAVESAPGNLSGTWDFPDTRLPVPTVIANLEDLSVEKVMEQFDLTREQFVARSPRTPLAPFPVADLNASA